MTSPLHFAFSVVFETAVQPARHRVTRAATRRSADAVKGRQHGSRNDCLAQRAGLCQSGGRIAHRLMATDTPAREIPGKGGRCHSSLAREHECVCLSLFVFCAVHTVAGILHACEEGRGTSPSNSPRAELTGPQEAGSPYPVLPSP
jgi:hypothetical protein